ncbi:two-component sensor histidine kinase [Pullulanibacillus camelliae]|uniref:histidine kinase n=1 Tax=Pullulanibacillus camelliae TaxID=1707096 RepID=A0A8J2YG99_9BACL|nr:sensor histidine kinase [Pullulanibacillus camelliae]GGE34590.1 two-component sensor histidine kinase [Pullulanibacillus camelliae]
MDFWMIITKLILIIYIAFTNAYFQGQDLGWVIFVLLIYFCLNLLAYIFHSTTIRKVMLFFTALFIILCQHVLDPSLIILLPLCLFELMSYYIQKSWVLLLVSCLPELVLKESLRIPYGLSTSLSFVIFYLVFTHTKKLTLYTDRLDKMRQDMQRLTRKLNENEAYIKQSEYTLKLEERNRLSQEIHDSIGHSMTGALIQMEAAKHVMNTDKEKATDLLQNAINISKEGIESMRLTLKNMKPETDQMGLNRLRLLIDAFSSKHGIPAPFTHKGNLDKITPLQWKVIIENTGEALTNVLKYANATVVAIDIQVLNKFVRLEIKDNGQGMEKLKKGLGIVGMEERTAALHGTIIVDGSKGFSVTTLLPLAT